MRRYIITLLCAVAGLLITSCEYYGGEYYAPERMGKEIWDTTYRDLTRVNEILDYVARYNYLCSIEDETEREAYRIANFSNATINIEQNIHSIIHTTSYGTSYIVKIVEGENSWHISRSGGNGYDLTITHNSDGSYTAYFNYFYRNELIGQGEFEVEVEYGDNPIISYTGTLTMTDYSASRDLPLTITTEITDALVYDSGSGISDGEMNISVYDALYDTTDNITVHILKDKKVIIDILDTSTGYPLL